MSAAPADTVGPPTARTRTVAVLITMFVTLAQLARPEVAAAQVVVPQVIVSQVAVPQVAVPRVLVRNSATARIWAHNMLSLINYQRHVNGLRWLKMSVKLTRAAHGHNLAMARANTMSHQLPGEAFFTERISRTGYNWRAAGENIGTTSAQTRRGLTDLEAQMYHEHPPDDGHRRNILSRTFREVGIDVYFDAVHDRMWFTQDFGRAA